MNRNQKYLRALTTVGFLLLTCWGSMAYADASSVGVGKVAADVSTQLGAIAKLFVYIAYVAGVAFALAGILQFKAHKDNPQSTPLSKPVMLIVVAACLLFLPSVMSAAGGTIFGSAGSAAGSGFTGTVTAG